jgi:hypothetical protein
MVWALCVPGQSSSERETNMLEPMSVVSASAMAVSVQSRNYYPSQWGDIVLIMYRYEDEERGGVDLHYDRSGQPCVFSPDNIEGAQILCDFLNSRHFVA